MLGQRGERWVGLDEAGAIPDEQQHAGRDRDQQSEVGHAPGLPERIGAGGERA